MLSSPARAGRRGSVHTGQRGRRVELSHYCSLVVLIYFTAPHSLGVSSAFSKHVRQRYEHHFGRPNQHLAAGNHSLVLLDAPGIVDEDYMRAGHGTSFEEWVPLRDGAIEFIKGLAAGARVVEPHEKTKPLITDGRRGTTRAHYPVQPYPAAPRRVEAVRAPARARDNPPRRRPRLAKDARETDVRVPPREPAPHDRLQVSPTFSLSRTTTLNLPFAAQTIGTTAT